MFHKLPSPIFTFGFHSTPQDLRLDSPYNNVSEAHDESDEHLANLFVCGRFQIHLFFLYNPMHVTCFITGRWLWDTWLVKAISPVQCVWVKNEDDFGTRVKSDDSSIGVKNSDDAAGRVQIENDPAVRVRDENDRAFRVKLK